MCFVYCLDCEFIGDYGVFEDGDDVFIDDVFIFGVIEFLNVCFVENVNVGFDDGVGINYVFTNDGICVDIGDFVFFGLF